MTTNLINELAADLLEVANSGCTKVHICHWANEIAARDSRHALEVHPIFGVYTIDEITKGLTSAQWYTLGEKVGIFLRSKS